MTADREALAAALAAHQTTRGMRVSMGWTCACGWWSKDQSPAVITGHQADALLPVIDQIANERAAAALEAAADAIEGDGQGGFELALRRINAVDHLRSTAAALRASNGNEP